MDIFTILVFFLMVNSGDVEVIESDKNIDLPESVSQQKPDIALTIKVSPDDIVVQGRRMGIVNEVLKQPGNLIEPLKKELAYQASRAAEMTEREKEVGRQVVIMGDRDMPYKLLKRIMTTCAQSDYRDITLAVNTAASPALQEPQLAGGG